MTLKHKMKFAVMRKRMPNQHFSLFLIHSFKAGTVHHASYTVTWA